MSQITELASGQITNSDVIVVVLAEPDDILASVIIHWPSKPVLNPARFGETASIIVRLFSEAHIALAAIKGGRRL